MKEKLSILDLDEVLEIQSTSYQEQDMIKFISNWIDDYSKELKDKIQYYTQTYKSGDKEFTNLYVTKGKLSKKEYYPCFVSHTDTVHDIMDTPLYIDEGENLDGNKCFFGWTTEKSDFKGFDWRVPAGCGGDDKVGIWACLNLLYNLDKCKLAFFAAEEVGTVGSKKVDKKFFKDVGYALQTDRRGNDDFVTKISGKWLSGKEFQNKISSILKKRNFKLQPNGGLTDVKAVKSADIDICCANISSGYYNPHSDDEYVVEKDALNTLGLMYDIAKHLGNTLWAHKAPEYQIYSGISSWNKIKRNNNIDYAKDWIKQEEVNDWNRSFSSPSKEKGECRFCSAEARIINNSEICVNPDCNECDVQYTMDFMDDYGYNGGAFYDAEQIYPVTDKHFQLLGYYSPAKDKLYYKPKEIAYQNPKQIKMPF